MAPKAKIPAIIECHSESALREELEHARASLSLAETEETWDAISNTLLGIMALLKGGACEYPTTLTSSIRSMYRPITSAAASERSRLSAAAVDCIAALATGLGPSFDSLVPLFIPTLLSICSRPNKIFISRAKAALQTIIDQTQLISLLPYFVGALRDKSVTLRLIAIEGVLSCVQCFNPPDLEKDARARDVENAIRLTATDASAEVRKISRNVFDAYKILLPSRVESFATPLSPTMKKYLNIDVPSAASRPPSSQSTYSLPATRPTSSMAPAPPKRVEPHPRPATSMAHHRSASSSTLASNAPLAAITSKLTRSQTEHTMAPPNGRPAPGPSSKRKDNMPPPAVIPQRRQPEPLAPLERLLPTVRPDRKGAERPPEASSSRTATQILRPDSMQPPVPSVKPHAGPLRGETMTIKERLLGGAQRVLLPETQQQAPAPSRPLLPPQEKKTSTEVQIVSRRSRLDSVRHGPKSTAAIDAKRAVNQVAATSSAALERPGASSPTPAPLVEKKDIPKLATQAKKDDSKPSSTAGAKGGNSKIPNVGAGVKKEGPKAAPSTSDRPKSSMSTRSTGKRGTESKVPRKRDNPKAAAPAAKKRSQPTKGAAASAPTVPAKKVAVRTGGVTQPTLSQLARMKAAEEEKERRLVAKGGTKGLMIRPKGKVVAPKAASKEAELPVAAITTPLPPSPEMRPADVPLPASPMETHIKQVDVASTNDSETAPAAVNEHPPTPTPAPAPVQPTHPFGMATTAKTPISALVSSIQRGFLFSPNSPLSPVQPDAEWECPAWPGLPLNVGEAPSFEGVEESTVKRPLVAVGTDVERRTLVNMN